VKKTSFISSLAGSFSGRKLRFGGYATLLVVAALAIIVVINVLVEQVPGKLDLTKNHLYSLSPETYKVLDGLTKDVTITMVARAGAEDPTVKEILSKYAARSHHIKLQTMDPERNPGWARQFESAGQTLGAGSVVVQSGEKYKTIGQYDMYNYDYSNPNQQPTLTSISVEQRVTSAILYVTALKNVTIYVLQGHGEQTLDSFGLTTAVGDENYAIKPLTLLTMPAVPADADILLVLAPKTDISAEDDTKIRTYLANGGRAEFIFDLLKNNNALPRLEGILESYGVAVRSMVVVEGNQNAVAAGNPMYLIPKLEYHDIVSPLRTANLAILMPFSQSIETLSLRKRSLKIEPLLSSSDNSWGKKNIENITTLAKQPGDAQGPFTLAVAITDPAADPGKKDTKLVVVASARFLTQSLSSQIPGNTDFFLNTLGWLRGKKDEITVRPKDMLTMRLGLNNLQALLFSGLVVILMPLLVLGAGFTVWIRRRHL
jgi:gliding motility-associatede transport system auxiliary component